ncbi:MAG TPA: DUF5985 family protein [Phycisphaerales bacterium]|nr:DUF5985 family protein [Phycisphaerales bacterium]
MSQFETTSAMMGGALAMGGAVVGLCFLRAWRRSGDTLFLCFAGAFWLLAMNWLLLTLIREDEVRTPLYALRIVAFGLIIAGIWNKNRLRKQVGGAGA